MTYPVLETWHVKGCKRFGDPTDSTGERVWEVVDFGDEVRVRNITDTCFVTRYEKTIDWRARLEEFVYYYLRAEVTKVITADGETRLYPTLEEWWKSPKIPH